jgi:hypothetical protein
MKRRILLLAVVASAFALPAKPEQSVEALQADVALEAATTTERGVGVGVTEKIAPTAAPPSGCQVQYIGVFALAVMNISAKAAISSAISSESSVAEVSSLSSAFKVAGSEAASASASPSPAILPSAAASASLAASATSAPAAGRPVSTVSVAGNPAPSAVVAGKPAAAASGGSEAGPLDSESTLTVHSTRTQTRTVTVRRTVVGQKPSDEPQPKPAKAQFKAYMISQIEDGQIQAPTKPTSLSYVSVASPGVPLSAKPSAGSTAAAKSSLAPAPTATLSVAVISQIGDGQIQAPVASAKPAAASAVTSASPKPAAASAVAAPQVAAPPAAAPAAPMADHAGMSGMSGMNMFKRQASGGTQLVTCKTPGTLQISLQDGILKDDKGRIGYIASNYQFQ